MDYGQEILNGAQVSHGDETDGPRNEGKFAFVTLWHACHVPNANTTAAAAVSQSDYPPAYPMIIHPDYIKLDKLD